MSQNKILVVDDEQSMREFLCILLEKEGYAVLTASSATEALAILNKTEVSLVVTDLQMVGMNGLELIARIRSKWPTLIVLAMTAYGSHEIAMEAMKKGAYDYITKPFRVDEIRIIVNKALENVELQQSTLSNATDLYGRSSGLKDIVGTSEAMRKVYQVIQRIADLDSTVLITGESGTGKELIARAIHFWGKRKKASFVSVNCGALPETLLESELFGHQKGSFTGAIAQKKGLIEIAEKGTFFLDEIGDTPMPIQVKLLQAIQTKRFKRVGDNAELLVDVRFIAATNRDLIQLVQERLFREDLYYRLNVIPIHLPPLRERKEDIPLLVGHFLKRFSEKCGEPIKALSSEALEKILHYSWPGNARELENVIERAVALSPTPEISAENITIAENSRSVLRTAEPILEEGMDLEQYLMSIERSLIQQALNHAGGNKTEAAKLLGLSFRSLRYRAEKLGF